MGGTGSSSMADMGGLVARGDGTAAGNPKEVFVGPRLNPRFGKLVLVGGGLVAEPDTAGAIGAVPLLNSAHRGHFRLVSGSWDRSNNGNDRKVRRTHVPHLTAVSTTSLKWD